jgi:hypothetical protein
MREFDNKKGTIIDNGERDGTKVMYRVKFDEPVCVRGVGVVSDDLFQGLFLRRIDTPEFSEELQAWLDNFSQSAAVDMGEGGDKKMLVAETCLTCIDVPGYDNKEVLAEFRELCAKFGHKAVLREAAKHVRTL